MSKLFAGEDLDIELPSAQNIEAKIENSDIPDIVETHETSIQVAVEGVLKASNDLYIVNDIRASLKSKKLSSVEYFTSIENYNLIMKSISNNIGVKTKLPSMEDFKNPYGIKASHEFIMEGFKDFIRNIWEKIKSFFKDFFKKIMLFLKRLVNANLEMEEYEQYIEDLMYNVKKSDKKSVDGIEIDSKLPSMLSDFGMESMDISYLLTKGQDKLKNLSILINYLTDKKIPEFEKDLKKYGSHLSNIFLEGYRPLPQEAKEVSTSVRLGFTDSFIKNMFTTETFKQSLPEDVLSEVLNNFDGNQLEDNNIKFHSLLNDRNKHETLPKNFNLYLALSEYDTSNDINNVRTAKLLIISHIEKNPHLRNNMKTISDRDNLIKFYEFYKKFSKDFKIDRINKTMRDFETVTNAFLSSLDKPFKFALESGDDEEPAFNTPEWHAKYGATVGERPTDGSADRVFNIPGRQYDRDEPSGDSNKSNPGDELYRPEVRREFEHLQKFVVNYTHCLQSFIKEFAVNIAATGQECRYEMIKLLYKSAKQF